MKAVKKQQLEIAERLFPLINENNKIYFSIMPDGIDPDDYIKQNGKEELLKLLKKKEIIQSFIWNFYLNKIDQNNPYEVSKFEKEIKKLSFSIQDETLKKYVFEDFLERIKKLTPIQTSRQNNKFVSFKKKRNTKFLRRQRFYILEKKIYLNANYRIIYIIYNFKLL